MGSLLLFSSLSLDLDVSGPAAAAVRVVTILGIVAGISPAVISLIPRLRRMVFGAVRSTVREAMHVLRGLRSPRRVLMLFGGNLTAELLFALALGTFVLAFGFSVPLHELIFVNMAVSLLAGLLPIPGGVGVTEGGLILGLTSFGVSQEPAFAAVILHRFSTFSLPPVWGFFSLRWLERNRYLCPRLFPEPGSRGTHSVQTMPRSHHRLSAQASARLRNAASAHRHVSSVITSIGSPIVSPSESAIWS